MKNKTYHKKKILVVFTCAFLILTGLIGRLVYLMVFDAEYYQKRAEDLHKRERKIKAARGEIVDRNGVVLATNKTVCTISVIHSQIKEPERVTEILAKELEMDQAEVRKRVEKVSSMEKVKTNVEKEVGDKIREYNLDGVKVDEDYKRYYPYDSLASKVLGFTGGDNQGIIGLEVKYEETLKGSNGTILTTTDARGIELDAVAEGRIEPVAGKTLEISMDYNIQKYCEQAAEKVIESAYSEANSYFQPDRVGCIASWTAEQYAAIFRDGTKSIFSRLRSLTGEKAELVSQLCKLTDQAECELLHRFEQELTESSDFYLMYKKSYFLKQIEIEKDDYNLDLFESDILNGLARLFHDDSEYTVENLIEIVSELEDDVSKHADTFFGCAYQEYKNFCREAEKIAEEIGKDLSDDDLVKLGILK